MTKFVTFSQRFETNNCNQIRFLLVILHPKTIVYKPIYNIKAIK